MLKFSVIMSIYKSDVPDYVRIALDSILNQTLLPNEIVIVGDGPVPAPLEQVIRDVQSSISGSNLPVEVNYLPQEKNQGLGEALRIAVENAKYDYLARMDSADICMPERFEKQMCCFEEDPDLSIVGGMITEFVDSPDNVVDKRVLPLDDEGIKRFMRSRCGVNHVTVIFKKADLPVLPGVGNSSITLWEGDKIFLRLMQEDRPCFSLKLRYEHRKLISAILDGGTNLI